MGDILGIGVTHYPGLIQPDQQMAGLLDRTLNSDQVPEELKDPARWPEPMRKEWADPLAAAQEHRKRLVGGFRKCREALDAFDPDFVLIWGDDQYENFREDGVPSFCVFAVDGVNSRPYARPGRSNENVWGEGPDTVFTPRGPLRRRLDSREFDQGRLRRQLRLIRSATRTACRYLHQHAPLPRLRPEGLPYPVVPFHVNCYGSSVIARRGSTAHLTGDADPNLVDPPGPTRGAASMSAARWRRRWPTARGGSR